MARSVAEWVGRSPDSRIPPRVKLRLLIRYASCCGMCRRALFGKRVAFDHILALILGGENRESNLRPVCDPCHSAKTALDVAEKSLTARKQRKHYGIKRRSRPIIGSIASGWRHRMNGMWERR